MSKLIKCPRCEKHTNPITPTEYIKRNGQTNDIKDDKDIHRIAENSIKGLVCEFCGWKIKEMKQ